MAAPATMLKTACLPIVAAQPQSRCEGQVGGKLRQNKLARAAWAAQSGGEGSSRTNSPARAVMGAGRWQAAHSRCFDLGGNGTSQPERTGGGRVLQKGGRKNRGRISTGRSYKRLAPAGTCKYSPGVFRSCETFIFQKRLYWTQGVVEFNLRHFSTIWILW